MLDVGVFFACATCFGKSDAPMAQGMNWGIFTLLGVIVTVLATIATFFVYIIRKETAATNQPAPQAPTEVKV
jgi:heme/copper-type cytochrome/quinol oxidase subunit 2